MQLVNGVVSIPPSVVGTDGRSSKDRIFVQINVQTDVEMVVSECCVCAQEIQHIITQRKLHSIAGNKQLDISKALLRENLSNQKGLKLAWDSKQS